MDSCRRLITTLLIVWMVFAPLFAQAATCAGSGLAWTCGPSNTGADIQATVNAASDTATITFTAGTYTNWNTGVDLQSRNGITLICPSIACLNPNTAPGLVGIGGCIGTYTNQFRVSGFVFTGGGNHPVWFYCQAGAVVQKVRVDHVEIRGGAVGIDAIQFGDASAETGQISAVIDHVNCNGPVNYVCFHITSGKVNVGGWQAGMMGTNTLPSIYIEDSICNFGEIHAGPGGPAGDTFGAGCLDTYFNVHTVFRFNSVINSLIRQHSYCHDGPIAMEVYGNTVNMTNATGFSAGYRDIHWQGSGELIGINNHLSPTPVGFPMIDLQHFRASSMVLGPPPEGSCNSVADGTVTGNGLGPATANDGNRAGEVGYPAWHQPGRDVNATLKPVYVINNTDPNNAGALATFTVSIGVWTGSAANCANDDNNRVNCQLQLNRDIFLSPSPTVNSCTGHNPNMGCTPFSGASGVGFGPLSERPSTCTPTDSSGVNAPDAGHGGVGYWATDQGTWRTAVPSQGTWPTGQQGVLFHCIALNTWDTVGTGAYTPFTYPHPDTGSGPFPPGPPTNFNVTEATY